MRNTVALVMGVTGLATGPVRSPSHVLLVIATSLSFATSCESLTLDHQYETQHLQIESALDHPLCAGDLTYYETLMSRTASDLSLEIDLDSKIHVFVWSDVEWRDIAKDYCKTGSSLNFGCYRHDAEQVFTSKSALAHELIHAAVGNPNLDYFFAEGVADAYSGDQNQFSSSLPSSYKNVTRGDDIPLNRTLSTHFIHWLRHEWGGERLGRLVATNGGGFSKFESIYGIPIEVAESMYLETAPAAFPALFTCDAPRLEADSATNALGDLLELDCDEDPTRANDEGLFVTRTFSIEEAGPYYLYSNQGWMRAARCLEAPAESLPPPREAALEDIPFEHTSYPTGAARYFFGGVFNPVDLEAGVYVIQIGIEGHEPGAVEVSIWPNLGVHPEEVPG